MKESRAEIEEKLAERKARLQEIETHGVDALSRYDIEIAALGNAQEALDTALMLLRNQISYYSQKLEEMPPEQASLF